MICRFLSSFRRALPLLCSTLVVLMTLGGPGASLATGAPHVSTVSPATASPGGVITLTGQGLDGTVESYRAWVRTAGAGFALDAPTAAHGGLSMTVGPVATATTGTVELWQGVGYELPRRALRSDDRMWMAVESQVFIAREVSTGGPLLSTLSTSSGIAESVFVDGRLRIDVGLWQGDPPPSCESIRVDAVIETGGSKSGTVGSGGGVTWPTTGTTKSMSTGPRWALRLEIATDTAFATDVSGAAALAEALADLLNAQFGDLGLIASAAGSQLTIDSVGGIQGGFATLVVSP